MDETFFAIPKEVSGLGRSVSEIGLRTLTSYKYFNEHAGPAGAYQGEIFGSLLDPLDGIRNAWRNRHVHLAANCTELGDKLNIAAWLYADQEKNNYEALNAHTQLLPFPHPERDPGDSKRPAVGTAELFGDPADYGHPEGIDYPPPESLPDDLAAVIADAAGWLGDVDDAIEAMIGQSPLRQLVEPIGGNWNDLLRLGWTYRIAGEAMEKGGDALAQGTARVDEFWDGMAAVAYGEYATKQVAAMQWEGACGRVIQAVAERAAEEISNSIRVLVTKVREMIEKEFDLTSGARVVDFLSKKIPFAGAAYQLWRIWEILRTGFDLSMKLVDSIRTITDAFKEFLSLVTSPTGYMNEQSEQKLAPITEKIEDAKLLLDIKNTADASPVYEVPKDPYLLGTGEEPWADA